MIVFLLLMLRCCCCSFSCHHRRPKGLRASYIKPVQAGSPSDASFVSRHANRDGGMAGAAGAAGSSPLCRVSTLFDYTDPVSPHLAAERDGGYIATDADIVEAIVEEVKAALFGTSGASGGNGAGDGRGRSSSAGNLVLVEAAGGVLSPAPSGSLQADAFRPMRLPVLLVGDGRLGGIGATLSALESLRMRGYSVLGIALFAQGAGCPLCWFVCGGAGNGSCQKYVASAVLLSFSSCERAEAASSPTCATRFSWTRSRRDEQHHRLSPRPACPYPRTRLPPRVPAVLPPPLPPS